MTVTNVICLLAIETLRFLHVCRLKPDVFFHPAARRRKPFSDASCHAVTDIPAPFHKPWSAGSAINWRVSQILPSLFSSSFFGVNCRCHGLFS